MGRRVNKYNIDKDILKTYNEEYEWVKGLQNSICFYDLWLTATDYHFIFDDKFEEVFSHSEYNDYRVEEGGYTDEEWEEISDFMNFCCKCDDLDITDEEYSSILAIYKL